MTWRPEGWKNTYEDARKDLIELEHDSKGKRTKIFSDTAHKVHITAFEDGADLMLELLKEKGAWMNPEQMRLLAPDRKYSYGWLCFIPEDNEEKQVDNPDMLRW